MRAPPWPLAIVTGALGAGKTTLIRRLLAGEQATETLVIVNEFGAVGLDHLLLHAVTDDVVLLSKGCLCCRVRQDLVRTLCDIRRDWLAGRIGCFARVMIETSGVAEPAPLVGSLLTHPLVSEAFALRALTTVVDGEHGHRQLAQNSTVRTQVRLADRLCVSKADRIGEAARLAWKAELKACNPLATIEEAGRATLASLFDRNAGASPQSAFACAADDHLAVSALLLRQSRPLHWAAFQRWLGALIGDHGDRLPRIKGCLVFSEAARPVVIQAVHHTFYPIETLSSEIAASEGSLVLIHDFDDAVVIAAGAAELGLTVSRS